MKTQIEIESIGPRWLAQATSPQGPGREFNVATFGEVLEQLAAWHAALSAPVPPRPLEPPRPLPPPSPEEVARQEHRKARSARPAIRAARLAAALAR